MHLIFMWSMSLEVSSYDITCNCDITGSPFFGKHGIIKEVVEI